ncbi:MAG: hypothetical protein CL882_01765 [Dehalococcoidia bacterium]|nr:hypothetical protein [Dehalococcoidia bacterium]
MNYKKNILVINQYYEPDVASSGQLLAELCEGIVESGNKVTVVVAQPSYESNSEDAYPFELLNGVNVHRIPMKGTKGRANIVFRVLGYVRFLIFSIIKSLQLSKTEDFNVVMTLSNPPIIGIVGVYLSKKMKIPYVSVLYDIHPDIVEAMKWISLPKFLFKMWNDMTSWIISNSDRTVVLGNGMKQNLINTKNADPNKVDIIPIWARPEFHPRDTNKTKVKDQFGIKNDHLLILFAGNIGIMQPVAPVIKAAVNLKNMPVTFLFLGGGVGMKSLAETIAQKKLTNVMILPYQPMDDFINLLSTSDACLVTLADGMEKLSVPSRAMTFMSAGKPIIAMMNDESDIAILIRDGSCGLVSDNFEGLVENIEFIVENPTQLLRMGKNARKKYEKDYSKSKVISEFDALFSKI